MGILVIAIVIGLLPGAIAASKGHNFFRCCQTNVDMSLRRPGSPKPILG
jgi:hypothetical protein